MRNIFIVLLIALTISLCLQIHPSFADQESDATDAAFAYLSLLDADKVNEAYESMTDFHKKTWIKEWWVKQNEAQREFYGPLINRSVRKITEHDSIQRHPDGKYIKIQYESSFQNKQKAYETIDLTLDNDGQWKATSYYCN